MKGPSIGMLHFVGSDDPAQAADAWNAGRSGLLADDDVVFFLRSASTPRTSTRPGGTASAFSADPSLYWSTSYGSFFVDTPIGPMAPAAPEGHREAASRTYVDDVEAFGALADVVAATRARG